MLEVLVVATAEIVQSWIAILVMGEAVFGTFAVAGKLVAALPALLGERAVLEGAEDTLPLAVEHLDERVVVDVAELVFGKHEVVAAVHVAVELHHTGVSALFGKDADTRRHPCPVGQRAVEYLHKNLSHIVLHPLVENGTQEVAPLLGSDREIGQPAVVPILEMGQMPPVSTPHDTLHDGRKLQVLAPVVAEEAVKLQRVVGIVVVDHRHRVPFHTMLLQQSDALHHLHPRRLALPGAAVLVVKLLRPVYRDAHQPVVLTQKLAPLIGEQRAVGLYAVVYPSSVGVAAL